MSLLNHLNLNYLRIFLVVYRTRSMTHAAKELHLTQSGVSQQIKSLEETLNITLFDRINRRIIPTNEAEILYKECSRRLEDLESALREISQQDHEPRGKVRIGLPITFGKQALVAAAAKFAELHQQITLELRTGLVAQIYPMLQQGKLDIAFADIAATTHQISQEVVFHEKLDLVCHTELLDDLGPYQFDREYFAKLPYISYFDHRALLQSWLQSAFHKTVDEINIRATVMDCLDAATFAESKVGAVFLPRALANDTMGKNNAIKAITAPQDITCEISICRLKKRNAGPAAQFCYDWLKTYLEKKYRGN